jgi:hypothetical protein
LFVIPVLGLKREGDDMAHLVEKQFLLRANDTLAPGLVLGGMASCAIAASIYDIGAWFGAW